MQEAMSIEDKIDTIQKEQMERCNRCVYNPPKGTCPDAVVLRKPNIDFCRRYRPSRYKRTKDHVQKKIKQAELTDIGIYYKEDE
jgi:hypothetical protein